MTKWKSYEEVTTYLLNKFASEFGLSYVEAKQRIQGHSGAEWEIDAKGIKEGNEGFVIVECRRYTSRLSQEHTAGLAYRITDTGAKGGIIVSPIGIQQGAKKVAREANIIEVRLTPDSTQFEYLLRFLNKIMVGVHDSLSIKENVVIVIKKSDNGN